MMPIEVPESVIHAARFFKEEGGFVGGLGASRAANILWDFINEELAKLPLPESQS